MTLCSKAKRKFSMVYEAVKIPEFWGIILFMFLGCLLAPSFDTYTYFFMLDVVGLDKFAFSLFKVLDFVGLFIGAQLFVLWFKDFEIRSMLIV